jgi:hypothetical protein
MEEEPIAEPAGMEAEAEPMGEPAGIEALA